MKSRMIGTVVAFALAVGSVLTVTADDVTLPAGYTKLDYIASTGTQCINTGCYPSDRLSIAMDLGCLRWKDDKDYLFGSLDSANFYCAYVKCVESNYGHKELVFVGTQNGTTVDTSVEDWAAGKVHIDIDGGDGTKKNGKYVGTMSVSVNGGTAKTVEVETSASTLSGYPLFLFGRNGGAESSSYRLYGMTATKADGTKLFDLQPCISPDGEIGVYDSVGARFLGNRGTGSFLTPSDVEHDLIENGSFDTASVAISGYKFKNDGAACPGWTFDTFATGLTQPGTVYVYWNRPIGKYAAFMWQQTGSQRISQKFSVTRPGDYVLSFGYACRPNYTAKPSHVEIYDAGGNLVGGVSTEVVGDTALRTTTVSYPNVAAGEYTIKLIHDGASGEGGCIFDNVSFTPAVRTVEEGGGVYLFDGDRTLSAALIEGKAFVNKSGSGELVAPASLGTLPSIRVPASTFSAQDGVATAYALNGALMLKGGSTLKVDVTADRCDTFAVAGLSTGSASSTDKIFVSVSGAGVSGGSITDKKLLVSGAGLSEADAKKFKVTGARGRCVVENGDLYLDAPQGFSIVIE